MDDIDCDGSPDRALVNRMALEDRDESYMLDVVAPLVAELSEGKNFVTAQQFADLMRWFDAELDDTDETMRIGRALIYERFEIIRVRPVQPMTITELANYTGLPRKTIHNWVAKTGVEPRVVGGKKLYDFNILSPFMAKRSEG